MRIIISNCQFYLIFVRLPKSGKLLVFIGNPLEEEATVTGNYTQQVTHTFFFHFHLRLFDDSANLRLYVMSNYFLSQILSLRIF